MRAFLIRHGESTWNASNVWQGHSDAPLSPRGRLQARAVATRLFGISFGRVLTSDLSRAYDTATSLFPDPEPDARLREIDVGAWAGLSRNAVAQQFPDEVAALREGRPVRIGGGESMEEFEARVDAMYAHLIKDEPRRLAVFTHGGVIRAIVTRLLGIRGRPSPLVAAMNASVTEIEGGAIHVFNDALHLDPWDQDSTITRVMLPAARLVLVAAEVDAPSDRRLTDLILTSLGIPLYYSLADAARSALANDLLADPIDALATNPELLKQFEASALALVATPNDVRAVTASRLGVDPRGLAPPRHGTVTQMKIMERSTELYSYGVTIPDR